MAKIIVTKNKIYRSEQTHITHGDILKSITEVESLEDDDFFISGEIVDGKDLFETTFDNIDKSLDILSKHNINVTLVAVFNSKWFEGSDIDQLFKNILNGNSVEDISQTPNSANMYVIYTRSNLRADTSL